MECVNCMRSFELRSKGFKRVPLISKSRQEDVIEEIIGEKVTPKLPRETRFLCDACEKLFKSAQSGIRSRKELFQRTHTISYIGLKRTIPLASSTPRKKPRIETERTQGSRTSLGKKVNTVGRYFMQSKYKSGLKWCLKRSKRALNAMCTVLRKGVRKEVETLLKTDGLPLKRKATLDTFQALNWDKVLSMTRKSAPLLYNAIVGSVTKTESMTGLLMRGRSTVSLKPILGCIMAIILSRVNVRKANLFQKMNAVQMWRAGSKRSLFTDFYHIGVSVGEKSLRDTLDSLSKSFDEEIRSWKQDLQRKVFPMTDTEASVAGDDTTLTVDGTENENDWEEVSDEDEVGDDDEDQTAVSDLGEQSTYVYESSTDEHNECRGYTLCWDNVGRQVKARHQTRNHGNKYMIWALAYIAKNRIDTTMYTDESTVRAVDIPVSKYLLNEAETLTVRSRMIEVVGDILPKHISALESLADVSKDRPQHEYSSESKQKSELFNIGIIPENPSTTAGVINILEKLHAYVPSDDQGNLFKLITWGDGLSCERHVDAQNARANAATSGERLEGLEPSPQEFHKRMLLMQDTMDLLFSGKSAMEKGTLFHLKNLLNQRSVSGKVSETFNYVSDFLKFVTEAYVVLFALQILKIETLDADIDIDVSSLDDDDKKSYLHDISARIVEQIWCPVTTDSSVNVQQQQEQHIPAYEYCFCKEDLVAEEEPMLKCDHDDCSEGTWFHFSCVGLDEDLPEGQWFCSDTCREAVEQYRYCSCRRYRQGIAMIQCSNDGCKTKWYHGVCIGLSEDEFPDEDEPWYCTDTCRREGKGKGSQDIDGKFEYTQTLVWRGLHDALRREAVRRNDGPLMTLYWKMDMANFYNGNHNKYFILGHRLISALSGWLPERLRMDLTWNRTVNMLGGPSRNDEMDLVNEFLNREFKDSIRSVGSKMTPETLDRHGKLAGRVGKVLDGLYSSLVEIDNRPFSGKRFNAKEKNDMELVISTLIGERLTEKIPGRFHKTFKNIVSKEHTEIKSVDRFSARLTKLGKRLDKRRRIVVR